jgi:hypothetical protein
MALLPPRDAWFVIPENAQHSDETQAAEYTTTRHRSNSITKRNRSVPRTQLETAIKALEFARQYSSQLLEGIEPDEWFRPVADGVTHLAWQVGHLAMAEYGLTMLRLRGKTPEDRQLISNDFFRRFMKQSVPSPDPAQYPPMEEILDVYLRVHQRALEELATYSDDDLREPLPEPYAVFPTKLGSVFFCAAHEMLHAGQIGLIRRQLGKPPVR